VKCLRYCIPWRFDELSGRYGPDTNAGFRVSCNPVPDVAACRDCWECGGYSTKETNGHITNAIPESRWPHSGPCPCCGRTVWLVGGRGYRFFCSQRCRNRVYNADYRKQRRQDQRWKEKPIVQCQVCGENFAPKRADARTCSPACRQKAYRKRARVT